MLKKSTTEPEIHEENYDKFLYRIKPYLNKNEVDLVMRAYVLSKYGHRGQTREGGGRYFDHPRAVALILIDELTFIDHFALIIALLHDIQEDTYLLDSTMIEACFGHEIMVAINLLTKDEPFKDDYIPRLVREGSWLALLVKMADRLHNMRTLSDCPPEKQRKQVTETREQYGPLIDQLEITSPSEHRWFADFFHEEIEKECTAIEGKLEPVA